MSLNDLKLLDCTLRDGGYVNDWKFGFNSARSIVQLLTKAKIDVIEVGFLRNIDSYDPNVTVCNYIEDLNKLLPDTHSKVMYSAMAMRSNYDINKLSPYCGHGIEMIRITAHDYDIKEGLEFAQQVQDKGYKLSINPINIMGYTDKKIIWLLEQVNKIHPYQFAIVDTFGSMKRRDLDRIVNLADNNLDRDIRLSLHLHENMSLGCCLAQSFIDKHLNRPLAVDGSLMGMGRIPGNLPIELIADYANEYSDKNYDIDFLMDAINDYISDIRGDAKWGYTPSYFLSAKYNLHRNYSEFLLKKGDLSNKDINRILSQCDPSKKTVFDSSYAEDLYSCYKNNIIDDSSAWDKLTKLLNMKTVLVVAPGQSICENKSKIIDFIEKLKPIVISVNFCPKEFKIDFAFYSNAKRYLHDDCSEHNTIVTSNLDADNSTYKINYNRLTGSFMLGCNSYIMLLKLLKLVGVNSIFVCGADGYIEGSNNYFSDSMKSSFVQGSKFNMAVKEAIKRMELKPIYITPSKYE